MESNDNDEEFEELQLRRRMVNQPRGGPRRNREDKDGHGGTKIKIPSFKGRSNPKAFLEWVMHVEQIFSCHNYTEGKKVKLAAQVY